MSHVIGFTNKFYTLWEHTETEIYTEHNGKQFLTGIKHQYYYIKNISFDFEVAKKRNPNCTFEEGLRGKTTEWSYNQPIEYPVDVFPFGKLVGEPITLSNDVWQLTRTFQSDKNIKRRAIARRRLIELGELVKYTTYETIQLRCECDTLLNGATPADWGKYNTSMLSVGREEIVYGTNIVRHNYVTVAEYDRIKGFEAKQAIPFLHTDGEKITTEIKLVYSTGYDGNYGHVSIDTYTSKDGNTYIYKDGSAPNISKEEFVKVTATVKHNEYNGIKQTLLQRIKIVK